MNTVNLTILLNINLSEIVLKLFKLYYDISQLFDEKFNCILFIIIYIYYISISF